METKLFQFLEECSHSQLRLLFTELNDVKHKPQLPETSSLFQQSLNTIPDYPQCSVIESVKMKMKELDDAIRLEMVIRFMNLKFTNEQNSGLNKVNEFDPTRLFDNPGC